jgi:hypothetical protein
MKSNAIVVVCFFALMGMIVTFVSISEIRRDEQQARLAEICTKQGCSWLHTKGSIIHNSRECICEHK